MDPVPKTAAVARLSSQAEASPAHFTSGEDVLRPPAAARFVGVAAQTLAKWRCQGSGPPFVRLGTRAVGYRRSDLEAWLSAQRRRSTSDAAE